MDNFLEKLKESNNIIKTENGALTHKSTNNDCLNFFALGGAMRNRSEADILSVFFNAFAQDQLIALKLLFYMRDARGGQGERRLFKTIMKSLGNMYPSIIIKNIPNIVEFGRWDDLFSLYETECEKVVLEYMHDQFLVDLNSDTPSLLGKWLPSENASSYETKKLAYKTRKYFKLSSKDYRKKLSSLRKKINILETLISQNRWEEIEYDKIPSKAGLKYRQAFYNHDLERYSEFMNSKKTKVNASTLYPYEIVHAFEDYLMSFYRPKTPDSVMINTYDKYWNNLKDYFGGKEFNTICVVDTSGSMLGRPIEVALSLGIYTAERAKGPFANHFITFSKSPELIEIKGNNIFEKIINMNKASWQMNTNIEAVFDLLLDTALENNCTQEEIPQNIIIISDMEFDDSVRSNFRNNKNTLLENISKEWQNNGYTMPHIIFWNVDARQNNIPIIGVGKISYVSGFSPSIFETILSQKSGEELMFEVINNPRYNNIII